MVLVGRALRGRAAVAVAVVMVTRVVVTVVVVPAVAIVHPTTDLSRAFPEILVALRSARSHARK